MPAEGNAEPAGQAATASREDPFAAGRRIGRVGALCVCSLMLAALVWLSMAPLNSAAIVPAQVKVESYRKPVQHLEGGMVRQVLVKAGDTVAAGQALLLLSDVAADASVQTLTDQLRAERVRLARAAAERARATLPSFADEWTAASRTDPSLARLVASEKQLFTARLKQLTGQIQTFQKQSQQVQSELASLEEQEAAGQVSRKLVAEELAMHQELLRREFIQQTRVMETKRALADRDERLAAVRAETAKARQKQSDIELKSTGLVDEYVKRASDEASEATRRIAELEERLRPVRDQLERHVVRAPAQGVVMDLRVHSSGTVVSAKETLMEIMPSATPLIFEGRMRPEDVADVEVGLQVDIQVLAFRQRANHVLTGKVQYVAGDATTETTLPNAPPYFLIRVLADSQALKELPRPLSAGMPATMFIQTKARTAMQYLLQPFYDAMRASMTER